MKLIVVYDNSSLREDLKPDWGFSCLIETKGKDTLKILFDTGYKSSILFSNMEKLGINPKTINVIVISHSHIDHTGGLADLLKINPYVTLYIPNSFSVKVGGVNVVKVKTPTQITENVYVLGEFMDIEQSLLIKTVKGLILVTGCSHPGLENIVSEASKFGKVYGVIGGFHGFRNYRILEKISLICPCHCTVNKEEIAKIFPEKYEKCGVGKVLEIHE